LSSVPRGWVFRNSQFIQKIVGFMKGPPCLGTKVVPEHFASFKTCHYRKRFTFLYAILHWQWLFDRMFIVNIWSSDRCPASWRGR
jgi:hypothetical protein